jgi:hypothetical protein
LLLFQIAAAVCSLYMMLMDTVEEDVVGESRGDGPPSYAESMAMRDDLFTSGHCVMEMSQYPDSDEDVCFDPNPDISRSDVALPGDVTASGGSGSGESELVKFGRDCCRSLYLCLRSCLWLAALVGLVKLLK